MNLSDFLTWPGSQKPSQARPNLWLSMAYSLGLGFWKPEAMASEATGHGFQAMLQVDQILNCWPNNTNNLVLFIEQRSNYSDKKICRAIFLYATTGNYHVMLHMWHWCHYAQFETVLWLNMLYSRDVHFLTESHGLSSWLWPGLAFAGL